MEVNSTKQASVCVADNRINPGFQLQLSTLNKSFKSYEDGKEGKFCPCPAGMREAR